VHALSRPAVSTAVMRTKYVAPTVRPVSLVETVSPAVGAAVGEATVWNDGLGQAGDVVPR
jgi:hypothetical protein